MSNSESYEDIIAHLSWVLIDGASRAEVHELAWRLVNATREEDTECETE